MKNRRRSIRNVPPFIDNASGVPANSAKFDYTVQNGLCRVPKDFNAP